MTDFCSSAGNPVSKRQRNLLAEHVELVFLHNRLQLQRDLEKLCTLAGRSGEVEDCIQGHRARVEAQIWRLKQLKVCT
ncbi:hypothetical protein PR048_015358 [Dryococelus australis]|uniref:Uncharacterized protein n=1 Tax=Dryococelus australis TaxID=614101 RepID=A0ABQ9HGQ6_9NEOP|nr:hypothetical protein PR048_015358 [Dryococelus australis]